MSRSKKTSNPEVKKGYDLGTVARIYNEKAQPVFHAPRGNSKTGSIPAWNLAPVITCSPDACKTCAQDGCYAVKNMCCHGYDYESNNAMRAWMDNTKLAKTDLESLEKQLDAFLSMMEMNITGSHFFRYHGSGDIFSDDYGWMIYRLSEKHSSIKFLAFTKQFDIVRNIPFYNLKNFSLVLSGWTGIVIPEDLKALYPVAYCVEPGQEPPENALECPGSCETCGACWFLREIGKNTYFHKH